MTRRALYLALSTALVAAPAFANNGNGNGGGASATGCSNSNGNAAGCFSDDAANGDGTGADYETSADKHDQTATSEVRVNEYLNAELTNSSDGFSSVTMSMNESGEVGDETFTRTFRVASNADHDVQIWYDAISVNNVCVPVFNAEGAGDVAGETDVIGGYISVKVGDNMLFEASAADSLDNVTQTSVGGVSITCGDSDETTVDAAVVNIRNDVASTFSREYTLTVKAYGENGSILFDGDQAINAGDAPAGQYDNDILIAAGTRHNYAYETQDAYADASFGTEAEYYGQ
jgi:hypothetical protein